MLAVLWTPVIGWGLFHHLIPWNGGPLLGRIPASNYTGGGYTASCWPLDFQDLIQHVAWVLVFLDSFLWTFLLSREITHWCTSSTCDFPCCTADGFTICQIVQHVAALNRMLFALKLELREVELGKLGQLELVHFGDDIGEPSEEEMWEAATILFYLIATHTCIFTLNVNLSYLEGVLEDIMCSALCSNSSIEIARFQLGVNSSGGQLWKVLSLPRLRELDISEGSTLTSKRFLQELSRRLPGAESLRILKIAALDATSMGECREQFIEALALNRSLTVLSVHDSIMREQISPPGCGDKFRKFLQDATALEELNFVAELQQLEHSLKYVFEGLLGNKSICCANIFIWFNSQWEIESDRNIYELLKAFFQNKLSQNVTVTCSGPNREYLKFQLFASRAACAHFQKGRNMPIPLDRREVSGPSFAELTTKAEQQVIIEGSSEFSPLFLQNIAETLSLSRARGVAISSPSLSEEVFPAACVRFGDTPDSSLETVGALKEFHRIKSLRLKLRRNEVGEKLSEALDKFLEENSGLEAVSLEIHPGEGVTSLVVFFKLLSRSLLRSRRLSKVEVRLSGMDSREAGVLADLVKHSPQITEFGLQCSLLSEARAFVVSLCNGIEENRTLLRVSLKWGPFGNDGGAAMVNEWLPVRATALRNRTLLNRAALHVAGVSSERCCVEALDVVTSYPSLRRELFSLVCRCYGHDMWAKSMDVFFKMTGVVRDKLVCTPSNDGSIQLTDLGPDCLQKIWSFLELEDVKGRDQPSQRQLL